MRLKRVKIVGFKTFADKTEFDLDGDIIAVVGPNGCGKSNIVDAILWGLGESNSRTLRAQTGREVIFAGSSKRKPVGYAEVTLHFDNEDGGLPIETPEVTVTRRLERSGDSDYFINRRSCRLKDVYDLLADSGLGRAGYAIVGQSDIDQALAASPQQRRAWIDEAAGVHRYRLRRQEAARRLSQASEHLVRVDDVLKELESQKAPLEEQAATARKYKALQSELKSMEVGILTNELRVAISELTTQREEAQAARSACDAEEALALAESRESDRFEAQAREWESRRDSLATARQDVQSRLEQVRTAEQVAQSRLEGLDELEKSLTEDAQSGQERVVQAEQDLAAAQEALMSRQEELDIAESCLGQLGEQGAVLATRLREAERSLEEARKQEAEHHRAELRAAHRNERVQALTAELQGARAALPELEAAVVEAESAMTEEAKRLQGLRSQLAEVGQERRRLHDEEEQLSAERRQLLTEQASLQGRRAGVEASIESHEGLSQGSKAVLRLVRERRLTGEFQAVGECVEVDPEFALAIETALGGAVHDLIVPTEDEAKKAISILRDERLGRATFQPLTLVRPQSGVDLKKFSTDRGVVGRASDLVRCESRFRPVVESLLGRILIVETLDDALVIARRGGAGRIVTLDGETVHGSGAVTGGRAARAGTGLIQRQAELSSLVNSLKSVAQELEALDSRIGSVGNELTLLQSRNQELNALSEAQQKAESEAQDWAKSLRHELNQAKRDVERLEAELATVGDEGPELGPPVDLAAAQAARDAAWTEHSSHILDREAVDSRLATAREAVVEAKLAVTERQRRLQSILASEASRLARAKEIDPQRERLRAELAKAQQEIGELADRLEQATKDLAEAAQLRLQASQESQVSRQKSAQAQQAADAQRQRLHAAELKTTRAEGRRATTLERLLEEYGMNEDDALALEPSAPSPESTQRITSLRREIRSMGEVNLGAVAAFERLMERWEELDGQREDILTGVREIESGIRELDQLTRKRFDETFEKVRCAFEETFQKLFGGGEASLALVEGEESLDAGIEIQVTVPGKKRQRLELLSGGERAMSAIAFLFALLRVKPSPLVILDEIDAPLDGRNVERFVSLMRESSHDSQFILITHNPVTIESADVWFGVTMQEPGVSSLVPYRVGASVV
ncbi:MAG: chromosome segregation protein SMC [Fimbriimonadaceae bacterium]|nr:chromosome segregation protein SMC [Fimbriimonadaceae bacterium]QYK58761.1 MAG: chromosome segregation protein SMC [Fimbriimonadaceae bacterium]